MDNEKRIPKIILRLTKDETAIIYGKAKSLGMPAAIYARIAALHYEVKP